VGKFFLNLIVACLTIFKKSIQKIIYFLKNILIIIFTLPTILVKNLIRISWFLLKLPFTLILIFLKYIIFIFRVLLGPSHKNSKIGIRFLAIIFIALIGFGSWAGFSEFDKVITAQAKVISSENLQIIQHFEGGIVKEIHVKPGEVVSKGQQLISLEPLEQEASYEAKKSEFIQALIKVRRLDAEYRGEKPVFEPELYNIASSQINNELLLFKSRKQGLSATLDSFDSQRQQKESELIGAERTLELVEKEKGVILTLVQKGLEPSLEAVRAEKSSAEAIAKVNTIKASIKEINDRRSIAIQENNSEVLRELAEANLELSKLEKAVSVAADKSDRSIIRSPSNGVVNRILISTIGGVLRSGENAVEIVPLGSELMYEAKISPMDIGYLQKGQKAIVKLSTYDFSIYGSLPGEVTIVGSDTVEEENGDSYYISNIKLLSSVSTTGRKLEIIPGMTAQIDIITGKRTVLSYISSPITKTMTTAFKEK
jgi:adhesin transport system membrane fusion protein